ncbi:MAG: hypothetical protein LBQ37_02745 [Elusimicrobiota bacterium]|jgi:hypothetical protein|nr:hypothetical protein [Elusimicrobiota bacterium]
MLKEFRDRSLFDSFCEDIGKFVVLAGFTYSVFVLTISLFSKKKTKDDYERLRKSYEGLSPDEY